jgi:hypothetical protein
MDTETSEVNKRRLTHREEAEQFYRALKARKVRIGMGKPADTRAGLSVC